MKKNKEVNYTIGLYEIFLIFNMQETAYYFFD